MAGWTSRDQAGVALLSGIGTPSLAARGGQRRPLQSFNRDRDIPRPSGGLCRASIGIRILSTYSAVYNVFNTQQPHLFRRPTFRCLPGHDPSDVDGDDRGSHDKNL